MDRHPEIEFVQIQLNYADWENPVVQSGRLYEILYERGIPMIIMGPVKGGTLAKLRPELEEKLKTAQPEKTIASWAFRFVGSLPGVMTILSGMSNEEQMEDNLATFTNFEPLTEDDRDVLNEVTGIMLHIPLIGCTACRYCCDGCPMNISIPDVFLLEGYLSRYSLEGWARGRYEKLPLKASACIGCGKCETRCPYHLPIRQMLKKSAQEFGE